MSIKNKIKDFLFFKEFKLIDEKVSDYFGDFYSIYSNEEINIRLVSDRSIETIDVCSVLEVNRWIDLEILMELINEEQNLSKHLKLNEYYVIFENHFSKICNILSKSNYYESILKIERLEAKRLEQMFPKIIN